MDKKVKSKGGERINMVFSSMIFLWLFLPVTFCGYYLIRTEWRNLFLLLVSLIFYAWGEPVYILLMMLSILVNYFAGRLIQQEEKHGKIILAFTVAIDLAILGYYKYFNFLIQTINDVFGVQLHHREIALPIGISFFSFQAISYVVDVYRGKCKAEKNPLNVALYISFFPQLIAGPIVKYSDIGFQISNRKETIDKIAAGVRRFSYGLGKKVIISNTLAEVVDTIVALEANYLTGAMAWIVAIFYTLQIYYDFSGYSDMAIGLSKLFGFDIGENFHYPYMSKTIREFWQRWHISLSAWFKEYVYIPLGGNRKGIHRTYINLFIVFFLTGLWHGASWNFIIWGAFHGFFMIIERIGFDKTLQKAPIVGHIYTLLVVIVGWVLFRFDELHIGVAYLKRMFFPWRYMETVYAIWEVVPIRAWVVAAAAILGCGLLQKIITKIKVVSNLKDGKTELLYCMLIIILSFSMLTGDSYNPFIYFKF